jgi:hypothetical protein
LLPPCCDAGLEVAITLLSMDMALSFETDRDSLRGEWAAE